MFRKENDRNDLIIHEINDREERAKMKGIKKRTILIQLIGVVIARAVFFQMNPLAIGYFTTAYLEKAGGLSFAAVLIGMATVMPTLQLIKYMLAMGTAIIIFESPLIKKRKMPVTYLYLIPMVLLGIFSIMEIPGIGGKSNQLWLIILEMLIAYISCVIFRKGMDFILHATKGYKMNNEQMISIAVMVAVIVYSVPNTEFNYIAPLETVIYFVILFFTYKYGTGQGTVTAVVCGLVLSLRGGSINDIALFSIMAIIPSIFRELGRIPVAAITIITSEAMGLLYDDMLLTTKDLGALISAIMIFLLMPKSLIYQIEGESKEEVQKAVVSQNIKKLAKAKMRNFSESFYKLSKSLGSMGEGYFDMKPYEINHIFEDISEKLCKNCANCSKCWDNQFDETYHATCSMFEIANKKGELQKEDIPVRFAENCICIDKFMMETNRGFEIAKLNHTWHNRMAESRGIIAEQLMEVSSVIKDLSGDLYEALEITNKKEDLITKKLKMISVIAKNIILTERRDKRKEIYLNAYCRYGHCVTVKEVAAIISEVLGYRMCASEAMKSVISKDPDTYIFVEDTKFKVLTGVSRAMKESISGDNFSILKMDSGEMILTLSDGMGTGKDAGEESNDVLTLLEQLMETGFESETAIKLINSGLVLKTGEQSFTTIDMSIINLYTGMCEFVKLGASAAFIKRNNWVETISSTTLPIGMLNKIDYDTVSKKLYEGDIIIMVTDGVLDSIKDDNKEAFMEKFLLELKSKNPQEIANRIIDKVLSERNYEPIDDMTVITAGLWLK
jgi:stage II sporulation protein E